MVDEVNKRAFFELVFLVALATCFKPKEDYLTEGQLFSRGFSPTEVYGQKCLAELIEGALIDYKISETFISGSDDTCALLIKCPAMRSDIDSYIYGMSSRIRALLTQSSEYQLYLRELHYEVIAAECIEYCNFYVGRENLTIFNSSHNNAKLRMLILDCEPEQVQMLLWRAMTNALKKRVDFEFSDLMDVAFQHYIDYKKFNIEIKGYKRPPSLKTSILSGLIQFFNSGVSRY